MTAFDPLGTAGVNVVGMRVGELQMARKQAGSAPKRSVDAGGVQA